MSGLDKYEKKLNLNPNRPFTNEEAIVEYYRLARKGIEFELTKQQQLIKTLCEKCFSYLLNETPYEQIKDMLLKDCNYQIKPSYTYAILRMTKVLFGDAERVPIEIERQIAMRDYKRIQLLAENAGDYKTAAYCRTQISKIQQLFKEESEKIRDLPPIHLTPDPKVLDMIYEDVPFEELDENGNEKLPD